MGTIKLPIRTTNMLKDLIARRNSINEMIQTVVLTAADTLNVPDGYELRDVEVGFEQVEKTGVEQAAPGTFRIDAPPAPAVDA